MKKNYVRLFLLFCCLLPVTLIQAQWVNGQNAARVIGQTSFTATGAFPVTDSTFGAPACTGGTAIDAKHGCMYVTDLFAHRVLRFAYPLTGNSPHANLVFGHTAFTVSTPNDGGLSASSLDYPGSCTVDTVTGTLWIADNGNMRVLRFDNAFSLVTNNPLANGVLGQTLFTTASSGTSASTFTINNTPVTGNLVHYDRLHDQLWIADNGNNRVLRFDAPHTSANGASANAVLGQTLFTTGTSGTTQSAFSRPDGLATIGNSLYVTDAVNNRILRFDSAFQLSNGHNAAAVIGQLNYTAFNPGLSQSQLNTPSGLAGDASGTLYVADLNNNRVLIFPGADTMANGGNAAFVLLKSNFTASSPSSPPTASLGGTCSTVSIDNRYGNLLVMDKSNDRYLIFTSCGFISQNPKNDTTCVSGNAVMSIYTTTPGLTYQWQENQGSGFTNLSNAGIYTGVTTPRLHLTGVTIAMNGYSYLCMINGTCLAATNSGAAMLEVNACAGITELSEPSIRIYPNPGQGEFVVNNLNGKSTVEVYALSGALVYSARFTQNQAVLELEKLSPGMYEVRVSEQGRPVFRSRIINRK